MSIEKILARIMATLAGIFLLLAITFYPPEYAIPPIIALIIFITADIVLPSQPLKEEKKSDRIILKIIVILLSVVILVCSVSTARLWRLGNFGRL